MYRKYPDTHTLAINGNEEVMCEIITSIPKGDFYIDYYVYLTGDIVLLPGIYHSSEYKSQVVLKNITSSLAYLNPQEKLNVELNNFEIIKPSQVNAMVKLKSLTDKVNLAHLNKEEQSKLKELLNEIHDIFYNEGDKLSFTNAIKHKITTTDELLVYSKSYRYPYCHKQEIQDQIQELLKQGIIQPYNSPWSSPIWIVPNKSAVNDIPKWRLVIDYRKLNAKTVEDRYPIPNINEILYKLGRSNYFSTLDLAAGYHQIEIDKNDISKTAFSVDHGHYEFLRMPFGLRNAPSTFQRVMDNILRKHIGKICLVYMDDIIIYSTSFTEHIQNIRKVFICMREYHMKIQLLKSQFLQKEVSFLGHIVTAEGFRPNPDKIEAVKR